jgi:NAD(P)-dependent dehydrogenase (short-subunit alcohol dehydrogenase family)
MTQSAGRVMRAQGSGVIINLITGPTRQENEAAFLASMKGVEAFTRAAARELSPYGVRVYSMENNAEKIVEDIFALLHLQMEER